MANLNRMSLARPGGGEKPAGPIKAPAAPVKMPSGLTPDERFIWRRWAPRAVAKRTLTEQTIPGFQFLVTCEAERRQMKGLIDHDGIQVVRYYVGLDGQEKIESITPHPLLGAYAKLQKQVEVMLARYGLAAFGKAEPDLPQATAANPWTEVGR